ncbi:hypothetical protein V5O48_010434 [Marasmius crinis-equi]|uniref:Uncharacterized protein n=1 Tax=Marasmius crinis-equi TaxID=585013 RepID=A0ABR3F8U6_9AGAR
MPKFHPDFYAPYSSSKSTRFHPWRANDHHAHNTRNSAINKLSDLTRGDPDEDRILELRKQAKDILAIGKIPTYSLEQKAMVPWEGP